MGEYFGGYWGVPGACGHSFLVKSAQMHARVKKFTYFCLRIKLLLQITFLQICFLQIILQIILQFYIQPYSEFSSSRLKVMEDSLLN